MTRNWLGRRNSRLCLEHLEAREVPATFTVNTTLDDVTPANGKFSLREAITKANTTPGADMIVVPAGVFRITVSGTGEDANTTGDFDITDGLTIQGTGAGVTVIDAQQFDRVIDIAGSSPSSITVALQGVTIRNGNVSGDGGGIRVANADLVVRDSAVTGNRATTTGGGVSNAAAGTGNVKLIRATVGRNVAGSFGGGLEVFGSGSLLTINSSTIRRNVAANGGGGIFTATIILTSSAVSDNITGSGPGGGIVAATATVTNSTISGNVAGSSSAGGMVATTLTMTRSTVSGNSAMSGDGGGIVATSATLTGCTINGNMANGNGGGIKVITSATLTNCTVSGNSAATNGGGIYAVTATLLNDTIAENIAHTGGGVFHFPGGTFNVRNTIVALNLVDLAGTGPDVSGAFTSAGHNLIGDGTGGSGFGFDIVGAAGAPIDPKLGPLANNGGPTKTMALLAGSPAIDKGDNAAIPPADQRGVGFARKKDGNGDGIAIVDIGAFER